MSHQKKKLEELLEKKRTLEAKPYKTREDRAALDKVTWAIERLEQLIRSGRLE